MNRIGTAKLRQENKQRLLDQLKSADLWTKRQLADTTGLTLATVGTILSHFLAEGFLIEEGKISQDKGRPTAAYRVAADVFSFISVVVYRENGCNYLAYQVVNARKEVLTQESQVLQTIDLAEIISLLTELCQTYPKISYLLLGLPAVIYQDQIMESDISDLVGLPLKSSLESALGLPVLIKNDMNFAALGRYHQDNDKSNLSYINLPQNSGPGCGTMIKGHLLEGRDNIAGEIIYLPFFDFLEKGQVNYDDESVGKTIASLVSIVNPSKVILTGDGLGTIKLEQVVKQVQRYLPAAFCPQITLEANYLNDYFSGMTHLAIDLCWQVLV